MLGLGLGEIALIFIIAVVFIGPKKLPEVAKAIGKGLREFQRAKNDLMESINSPDIIDTPNPKGNREIQKENVEGEVKLNSEFEEIKEIK